MTPRTLVRFFGFNGTRVNPPIWVAKRPWQWSAWCPRYAEPPGRVLTWAPPHGMEWTESREAP